MIKLRNLKIGYFYWMTAVVAVAGLVAAIALFWINEKEGEKQMVERLKSRELVVARAGAMSISDFLESRKEKLLLLSMVESIQAQEEERGREVIRQFIDETKDKPLSGIARVDKEGKIVWSENADRIKVEENVDISDRSYFLWTQKQGKKGEVFISEPMAARSGIYKGKLVVVMATPVFYQDQFNGLVFIAFPVEALTERYVLPLTILSRFESMIIASDETILASSKVEMVGKKVSSYLDSLSQTEREIYRLSLSQALEDKEGNLVRFSLKETDGRRDKLITAYSPVKLQGQTWSLWVSTPYEEAATLFFPLRQNLKNLLLFGFSGLVILTFLFIWEIRAAQRDGFLEGFAQGKQNDKD